MTGAVAGIRLPGTEASTDTTRLVERISSPLLYDRSRRTRFLLEHGFSADSAEIARQAVALHSTPEIPGRMRPEIVGRVMNSPWAE